MEIFQNCNISIDAAFDFVRDDKTGRIYLEHGEPVLFGEERDKGVRQHPDGSLEVVDASADGLLVHDAHAASPGLAFALSRLTEETAGGTPIGVFRDVERPVYDELMSAQLETARETRGEGELDALLTSGETWTIA